MHILAIAIAGLTLLSVSQTQAASERVRSAGTSVTSGVPVTDFSAAKRRKKQVRTIPDTSFAAIRAMTHQAEPARVACPRSGCQPVPRGCLREPERTMDGTPTGFDAIVCPMR